MSIKRIFSALICAVMLVGFTACEKEEFTPIGSWQLVKYTSCTYDSNGSILSQEVISSGLGSELTLSEETFFDGTEMFSEITFGTYKFSGNFTTLILSYTNGETLTLDSFFSSDDKMSLTYETQDFESNTIDKLTLEFIRI